MKLRHLLPLLAAGGLSACAGIGPDTSYVSPLASAYDASVLAVGISSFVATRLPPLSTTLALDPTPEDQAGNALTPFLADALRRRGFAIAGASSPPGAHTLRYWVTSFEGGGEVVRLRLDAQDASGFFARSTAGYLQSGGPFTVMQMEASR